MTGGRERGIEFVGPFFIPLFGNIKELESVYCNCTGQT
jgi:hypothetical protein